MAYRHEYATMTDQELVGLFQSGEVRTSGRPVVTGRAVASDRDGAFTAIVERYQRRVYAAARRMAEGDHDAADELAQETFVKAYDALAKFRGESQLYTWLYRIMMNAWVQQSRKAKRRPSVHVDDVAQTLESSEATPIEGMERSETTRLIEEAIESLPPKQRQVFMMRFYDELPYEDIAEIVGTSVGGLKANYFHAVKKVGEYLKAAGAISGDSEAVVSRAE